MIIQQLLKTSQHSLEEQDEEVMNLFIYMSQLSAEAVTEDVESASKLMFHVISKLYPIDFNKKYLNILYTIKENSYVDVPCPLNDTNLIRVCIRDKFTFQIVLLTSLKYKKSLFLQNNLDSENTVPFLQHILIHLLDLICIDKSEFLYILKFLEMVLKKREDIVTSELSLITLKCMNKVATSPITGFKHSAHNISRIMIRSMSPDTKSYLCNFNNLPIKGVDLKDMLRLVEEREVRFSCHSINHRILKLFCNNTDSRDGSFYYETLISFYSFDEFVSDIWPFYSHHLEEISDGEFYQSFLKYWIPATVLRYKHNFYSFAKHQNIDHQLKAYILLELKKKGHYDKLKWDSDALSFLKFPTTDIVGLKIISTFPKKNFRPDYFEIQAVQHYCNYYYSDSELSVEALKCMKQFISQIFFVSHQILSKNFESDLSLYSKFLVYMYKLCMVRITEGDSELSAQLLKIIWDIAAGSSTDLLTRYKIDRENVYDVGGNLYYLKLRKSKLWIKTFLSESLLNEIKKLLGQNWRYCPNLVNLVKERYLQTINLDFISFRMLLEDVTQPICLQISQKTRLYADLILAYKKLKGNDYHSEVAQLFDTFNNSIDLNNLFYHVLMLEIFIIIANDDSVELVPVLEESMSFFEKILDEDVHSDLNIKTIKIVESFINNVIECLMASKKHWSRFHKQRMLNQLCKIIKKSNLKRPVSMSINLVQHFGTLMEQNDEDREIKIKLLSRTLNSLYCNKQGGKIRRHPETRLVIHALCLSDNNRAKPYLLWSLNFMLEVLSNPSSSDYTLSATLHSLEVLVSDNSIHQFTLPYIPNIIEHCVRLFIKTNWIVRNADLQLLKSLIERFLGVLLDDNLRPKTIEDLFVLFPSTVEYFYKILTLPTLTDSAVIVLLFFSESQIKTNVLLGKSLENDFEKFRHVFVHIIKNYSNKFGFLAIKAFTSLCVDSRIPEVFVEIVNYIQRNFGYMRTNVFVNLIKLLQELYYKHKTSLLQTGGDTIKQAMGNLMEYLKHHNCVYFNLLSLKLYTMQGAIKNIISILCAEMDYKKRIWLNNYVPFVVVTVGIDQLGSLLNEMLLLHEIPDFLQVRILSILVDRLNKKCHTLQEVINILILKLTKLEDSNTFLIVSYSKSIFLFYEIANGLYLSNNLISKVRQDFRTTSIYKIFVYVLVLEHVENKTNHDEKFLDACVEKYIDRIVDDEIVVDLAPNIVHLYKSSPKRNRCYVIKMTFYLLLNHCTSFEMCKFVSFLSKSQCSTVLASLVVLLKLDNLALYVGDDKMAVRLLSEFYRFVDKLSDELEESDTYYLIENDFSLPKLCIKKIILQSLSQIKTGI